MAPTQAVMMPPTLYEVMDKEPGVQIRRQMRLLEELIGYEQNNKYVVRNLPKPGQDDGDTEYLLAAEKSTWCERNCYPPDCAPWRMDIYSLPSGKDDKSMLHIEKPCQCTFCCLNRPEIFITDPNTGAAVASIKDPFACCDMTIDVKDTNGEVLFHTVGGCCQCGLHCPCPGQEVNFQIQDPTTKEEVAHLKKIWMLGDCCPFMSKEVDNFQVDFGKVTDPKLKTLIFLVGIMVDFRFFSQRQSNNGAVGDALF